MLPLTARPKAGDILRVLQALTPDATDPEGEWWAKTHSPFFFFTHAPVVLRLCAQNVLLETQRDIPHEDLAWSRGSTG